MKRQSIALVLVVSLLATIPLLGQAQSSSDPIKLDPNAQRVDFVPNVILVRFKDELPVNPQSVTRLSKVGATSVDAIFQKYQVTSVAQLFKDAKPLQQKQMLKSFNGKTFERPSLHNIYKLNVKDPTQLFETIEALKNDPNVIYAEPNYIYSIVDDKPVSGVLTPADVKKLASEKTKTAFSPQSINVVTPNDPLYPQQWYIPAVHADAVWDTTTGDTSQVIAFLDTGVDWHHPDLADNIWTNTAEANGVAGVDDDGDGFVDDIHGWDFINNDNDPSDDNSHGTHVAGIACAEGNNGIGIAGVNWHARIMPIKVFQSNGQGDAATISQGINYAAMKGATVINMSFGSYARSMTMEAALQNAYANCVLVAAAGNDGNPINAAPSYPAALSYVLGVQATQQYMNLAGNYLALFSNYDDDGPSYSIYPDLLNYEISAPGDKIISTIPNGDYRVYSGTSMATPIVSGAVALYKTLHPDDSQELMWGNLINTDTTFFSFNLFDALNVKAKPLLWFVSNTIVDTLTGDNSNGLVDAGETIQLWFTVRNTWGQSDSVFVGLRLGEFEDTSVARILNPTAFLGSISPYATRTNETNPFSIRISPSVAEGRNIVFQAMLWYRGAADTTKQQVVLTASNGQYLAGVLDSTLVLTPDRKWIVNNSFKIGSTGHLILKPGTQLLLKEYIINNGIISGIGTKDSVITISGQCIGGGGSLNLQYASFENMSVQLNYIGYNDYRSNDFSGPGTFLNCSFSNLDGFSCFGGTGPYWFDGCRFQQITGHFMFLMPSIFLDCAFDQIYANVIFFGSSYSILRCNFNSIGGAISSNAGCSVKYCNFSDFKGFNFSLDSCNFSNSIQNPIYYSGSGDIDNEPNIYWGTTDSALIEKYYIHDFWDDPALAMVKFTPFLTQPTEYAHGFVWKVLVDGIDPQDQKNLMNPIGVGAHRFDVYFNRPMDITYTPQLSFGVRTPFNQQAITDSAHWSTDHRIWTAYKTIKLYTGDGINTISVSGAKDPEGFDIPVENMRFNFLVDAAGTSSLDFMATPGLGKINLEWNNTGLVDFLGFNMYRFTNKTDTTYTDTTLISTKLITDTLYTDYNVIPGKKYYYLYKVVNTDFTESNYSHVAGATVLTSSPGDANGDLAVNVLDIVSTVSFILGGNPQPFIFAAADINKDSTINVLDVVAIVNIILHPQAKIALNKAATGSAHLDIVGSTISLTSDAPVAAIQFKMVGKGLKDMQFTPGTALSQFEIASNPLGDTARLFLMYNMKGLTLSQGTNMLGTFVPTPAQAAIVNAIISDAQGHNILTNVFENGKSLIPTQYSLEQNFPNPFNPTTHIQYALPEIARVKIVIYNMLGQKLRTFDLGQQAPGRYTITWDGKTQNGALVSSGVYFYRLESNKFTQTKKLLLIK